MAKIETLLTDIDGTLLDTRELIEQAAEHTLSKLGFNTRRDKFNCFHGLSLQSFYAHLAPGVKWEEILLAHVEFEDQNTHLIKIFPNVLETLEEVRSRGLKIGAITNRFGSRLPVDLKNAGLSEYLQIVMTPEIIEEPKPNPRSTLEALRRLGSNTKNALFVGDTRTDILAGKNAGVKTVGVTYGSGGREGVKDADHIIENFSEILQII